MTSEPDLKTRFRDLILELAGDDHDLGTIQEALPPLTAFASEYAAPGFVCVMAGLPPTPPIEWPGVDGIAEAWDDYGGSFEYSRAHLVEVRESETHVVVLIDQHVKTRHGGVEMSQPSAMVFEFSGEQVTRVEFHLDQTQALRVAGLG